MFILNGNTLFKSARRSQSGAAMIETVVSLFVLAIGLMGTLSMQVNGLNSNQRAHLVTDANLLAADMADRILAYNSDDVTDDDDDYAGIYTADVSESDPSGCLTDGCDSAEQKKLDAWEWSELIKSRLPGGTGEVLHANSIYTIVIKWNQNDLFVNSTCDNIAEGISDTSTDKACFAYQVRL